MKKYILLISVIVFIKVNAQTTTLSPAMINTAGGSGIANGTYYDWTVGEPVTSYGYSSNGCTGIFAGFQHCTVDTLRTILATITANSSTTFCNGGSVTLSAASSASYLWSNSATTQSTVIVASGSYSVRTINTCGDTLFSNPISVTVLQAPTPSICEVTVDSVNYDHNIIYWERGSYNNVTDFLVLREISAGNYSIIGSVPAASPGIYEDFGADPRTQAYRYKLMTKDTCQN